MALRLAGIAVMLTAGLACSAEREPEAPVPTVPATRTDSPAAAPSTTAPQTQTPAAPASAAPSATPAGPAPSDGTPRPATLAIPTLGIEGLRVVPYAGRTDDAPGTRIQDRGLAASPHGPDGGVGPGGIGNYQVTAHRLSSTQAFLRLPDLREGDRVVVESGGKRYVYRITATRRTSFRDPESLERQRAAVPGRPGVPATRAMITLSTCATPEDRAAGNFWSDEFGNPEHRIDKVGVLVAAA